MGRPRSWTDEQLIAAVQESATIADVLSRLGLAHGGGSLIAVRRRMLELGLDRPDLLRLARSDAWAADPDDAVAQAPIRGRWTEDELRMAVVASTSMRQVMEYLGYGGSGGAWTAAKAQILALGLDTSHFGRPGRRLTPWPEPPRPRRTWSDDDLRQAVASSKSIAGVIRALGLKVGGSVYTLMHARIDALDLDTSHFTGQAWSRGRSVTTRPGRPLADILVAQSDYRTTSMLRKRLIKEGLKPAYCEICGLDEWRGKPLSLQLDHINGARTDNRLENLRIVCPNCHSQTDTWCVKNVRNRRAIGTMGASASVAKLANARDSSPRAERLEGSSPSRGTIQLTFGDLDALD